MYIRIDHDRKCNEEKDVENRIDKILRKIISNPYETDLKIERLNIGEIENSEYYLIHFYSNKNNLDSLTNSLPKLSNELMKEYNKEFECDSINIEISTNEIPTTERPITVKPTTVKPTTETPTAVKPTTIKPTTETPTTKIPPTMKPSNESHCIFRCGLNHNLECAYQNSDKVIKIKLPGITNNIIIII